MNMLDRLAIQAVYSKKGRKMIHNTITVMIVSFALIFGAIISMLTAPAEIRSSFFSEKEIRNVSTLPANARYFNSIPMIDSLNIKMIGRYPWPLNGTVTCQYGWRTLYGEKDFHGGIDISTGKNDPVISIDDGTVEKVHTDKKSYGLYILIKHDDGFYTLSAHLAQAYVKEGERVKQGETIALEGGQPGIDPDPGRSTGRHLHFEIRQSADSSSQINPLAFLNQ
jgi:Membrane proteins related to metalloendopeptidases